MNKAINIESSSNNVVRVHSIADESAVENSPNGLIYFLITDYTEPPALDNSLSKNYPMYDRVNQQFKWVQIQYQNTATEELLEIENLKAKNVTLQNELQSAHTNINILTEALADVIGGAL